MTRCASEHDRSSEGLGWRAPSPIVAAFDTPRLRVRPFDLDDVGPLFDCIAASRQHLYPWITWAENGHRSHAQTAAFVSQQMLAVEKPESFSAVSLAVTLHNSGEIIGGTGIHDIRTDTASAETGYWIAAEHTRNGYAAEACRHTISWAFRPQDKGGMGLQRVRVYCSDRNEPSCRLIESLGIRKEVEQRADYWIDGIGPTTRLGWGVMADEWNCDDHSCR